MPEIRPSILALGVTGLHARLRAVGFCVSPAATLLDSYAHATRRLATTRPTEPLLILLALDATEPGFPELAAPQLAAALAHEMHGGSIQPAWLIGLASGPIPDGDAEAYLAGCHVVLHCPLSTTILTGLSHLAQEPALLPPTDRATAAYQRAAVRVLHAVQAAQITLWTADDVRILLATLTRYPAPDAPATHTKRVLRVLGGPDAAYQRLHALAEAWRSRFPVSSEILWRFLNGSTRREIVSSFVSRDLYEDSRIYACITTLPDRIAQELRIAQAREEAT